MDATRIINRAAQRRSQRTECDLTRRTFIGIRPGIKYGLRAQEEMKKPKPFPEYEHLHAPLSSWRDTVRRDFVRGTALQEHIREPKWREFELRRKLLKGSVTLMGLAAANSLPFEKARAAFAHGGVSSGLPPGFLQPGHWFINQAMLQIHPQASGAPSNAAHLNIYYDGVNSVPWYNGIPLGVAFGAYPYVVTAATLAPWMSIGQIYGSANYLRITGTPTGAWSSAIAVTLTGQDLSTLTLAWTPETSDALAKFIFMATGGSDSNNGSIGSPFGSDFVGAFGSASTTTANPGSVCFIRAGSYTLPSSSDTANHFRWDTSLKPAALVQFPGESVTITTGGTPSSPAAGVNFVCQANGSDTFVQGITLDGYDDTNANFKLFAFNANGNADRVTIDQVTWNNSGYGTTGTDNAGFVVSQQVGNISLAYTNFYINQLTETGRQSGNPGNNFGICSFYTITNILVENCYFDSPSSAIDAAVFLKSDIYNGSSRGNLINPASCNYIGTLQQIIGTNGNLEFCYNTLAGVNEIYAPGVSGTGPFWVDRNCVYSYSGNGVGLVCNGSGTAQFNNNAVKTSHTPVPSGSGSYTSSGNLVGTGVLNSNGTLASAYSSYLGTVGSQIA